VVIFSNDISLQNNGTGFQFFFQISQTQILF